MRTEGRDDGDPSGNAWGEQFGVWQRCAHTRTVELRSRESAEPQRCIQRQPGNPRKARNPEGGDTNHDQRL